MWYVVFIIAGISLGLGMMFWALSERKKRTAAERSEAESRRIAENNIVHVDEVLENLVDAEREVELMANEMVKMQKFIEKNVASDLIYEFMVKEIAGRPL